MWVCMWPMRCRQLSFFFIFFLLSANHCFQLRRGQGRKTTLGLEFSSLPTVWVCVTVCLTHMDTGTKMTVKWGNNFERGRRVSSSGIFNYWTNIYLQLDRLCGCTHDQQWRKGLTGLMPLYIFFFFKYTNHYLQLIDYVYVHARHARRRWHLDRSPGQQPPANHQQTTTWMLIVWGWST